MTAATNSEMVATEFPSNRQSARRRRRLLTTAIIITFWVVTYFYLSLLFRMMSPDEHRNVYVPRAFVSAAGILISFVMVAVQQRMRDQSLGFRAVVAGVMAIVATAVHSSINMVVFETMLPDPSGWKPGFSEWLQDFLWRSYYFFALSAIILALSYAIDIREREERISVLRSLANSAQMRALRNQLNPHSLFNALNSIAGLISMKRNSEAEAMTENLADFLRVTLSLDPHQLITLDEELELQSLYLDIEKARFPDRLRVMVDVPQHLRAAKVPSLVTQPLIENSIKYAVARSTCGVDLTISAKRAGEMLEIVVEDSGGDAGPVTPKGARLGLSNVAERIRTHYGDRARFAAEPLATGGFRNLIRIPLEMQQ